MGTTLRLRRGKDGPPGIIVNINYSTGETERSLVFDKTAKSGSGMGFPLSEVLPMGYGILAGSHALGTGRWRQMDRHVSVVLCSCNGERFLREQLDSLRGQTYGNIEILVSDDASNDGTIEILEEYRRAGVLRYRVNPERLGVVKNFERAIGLAKGDYIALCDQDDIWEPEKIEVLVREIGPHPMVFSDASLVDANGRVIHESNMHYANLQYTPVHQFESLLFHNFVQGATALFRKDLVEWALPIPRHMMVHDWWLAIVASRKGTIRYLPRGLVRYRIHDANQTRVVDTRSLPKIIGRYLRREETAYRDAVEGQVLQLTDLLNHPLFEAESTKIAQAIAYHRGILGRRPHLVSFLIALRNRHILYPSMTKRLTLFFLLRDLWG
jgi:glycosyltransferase involved in cell wall biosynthesis